MQKSTFTPVTAVALIAAALLGFALTACNLPAADPLPSVTPIPLAEGDDNVDPAATILPAEDDDASADESGSPAEDAPAADDPAQADDPPAGEEPLPAADDPVTESPPAEEAPREEGSPPDAESNPPSDADPAITPTPQPTPSATPGGASILSFEAASEIVDPGTTLRLSWETEGVFSVMIRTILPQGTYGQWYVGQETSGYLDVIIGENARNYLDFQIVAEYGGDPLVDQIRVEITCPDEWFFTPAPEPCPMWSDEPGEGVAQWFEHGLMIWHGESHFITVLFEGGEKYNRDFDAWTEDEPVSDPDLIPPEGLYQPERGFGKVWRKVDNRERLGWATGPEFAIETAHQCATIIEPETPNYCYVLGPDGVIYETGFGWRVWEGTVITP